MSEFLRGLWTVASIDLRQRVRGVAWYVLLGVFVFLILIVTAVATMALDTSLYPGSGLYSTVIFFVLLLASLVTPALSGNAVNGDRDAGTLATMQVTLVTTPQIVLGKFLAAWISSLVFLAAATPFVLFSFALSEVPADTVLSSLAVLIAELGVISAVGVGLSGLLRRPLFSIVVTYLVVALLSVGTLIAFGLGGAALQQRVVAENHSIDWMEYQDNDFDIDPRTGLPVDAECTVTETYETSIPRFDLVWWTLAANPYIVLADAAPTHYDQNGTPVDVFGYLKLGLRSAQLPPDLDPIYSECQPFDAESQQPRTIIESTVPGWFVGLGIHVALGAALLAGAIVSSRTPARRLAPGSRIA